MGAAASRQRREGESGTSAHLPLALPAPSPLPGRIKPEASIPCATPFDAAGWHFSVDWAGSRALLFTGPDGVIRLQGERLDDLTGRFPEITAAGGALAGRDAVLDGVIAVLDPEGRPDLEALGHRLASGRGVPEAAYLAADLLHLDGAPTMSWPLERRLAALNRLVTPDERIQVTEPVAGEGTALAGAAAERGLTALLARRAAAPYRPGLASPDRLRIELVPETACVVTGVALRSPGWGERRLLLGEHDGGRLVPSGVAGASFDPVVAAWLDRWMDELSVPEPPLEQEGIPGARWLRAHLVATVRHAGRRADGTLVDPTLVTVRDDVDPLWCRRRAAVPPPVAGSPRSCFRPTVLVTLPMHP